MPEMTESMQKPIRWGILGTGIIAAKFVSSARVLGDAEVLAAASATPGKAKSFAEQWGIPRSYADYESLVADPEVDAVYVANLHNQHHAATLLALRAGKHVLCEKPMALNAREAGEMAAEARGRGLFLMEAMWTRFLPAIVQAREWIADGRIGRLKQVEASMGFVSSPEYNPRLFDPALAGGTLLDIGIYPLALASMLVGGATPRKVQSLVEMSQTGVDSSIHVQMEYAGPVFASFRCSINTFLPNDALITGDIGSIQLPANFNSAQEVRLRMWKRTITKRFPEPREQTFRHQIAEVHRCLRAGLTESTIMPLDETILLASIMDGLRADWGLVYPGERLVTP